MKLSLKRLDYFILILGTIFFLLFANSILLGRKAIKAKIQKRIQSEGK